MGNALIIDNWLLQDIGGCLSQGLSRESASEIAIHRADDSHTIRDVPEAGVQIEALLGFLVDIVLRDSIVVDSAFTNTWADYKNYYAILLGQGLMRLLPLGEYDERLKESKQYALEQLCVTSTLREAQQKNERSWAARKEAENPYMSNVIWGTAGMLSRSHVFEAPYSGHPLRKRVIEQTVLASPSRDAVAEILEWMSGERLHLYETKVTKGLQRTAALVLPPIAVEIIEESTDIVGLITTAYQLRDKYAGMREWMRSIQTAIECENPTEMAKYKKTLEAVSKDLNRAMGKNDTGKITLKIGMGWPSISILVGTFDDVMKKFGMRAMLNDQIFTGHGEKSVKKLLRMFGEEKSKIGLSVQQYLRANIK
jgi:hypothetical protein